MLLWRHLRPLHFPFELLAQLSISDAVQPRHAPRRGHISGGPWYLLFAVFLTQRDVRKGPHVLLHLRAVAIVDHV